MSRLLVREVRKAGNGSDRRNISMIIVNTAGDPIKDLSSGCKNISLIWQFVKVDPLKAAIVLDDDLTVTQQSMRCNF